MHLAELLLQSIESITGAAVGHHKLGAGSAGAFITRTGGLHGVGQMVGCRWFFVKKTRKPLCPASGARMLSQRDRKKRGPTPEIGGKEGKTTEILRSTIVNPSKYLRSTFVTSRSHHAYITPAVRLQRANRTLAAGWVLAGSARAARGLRASLIGWRVSC